MTILYDDQDVTALEDKWIRSYQRLYQVPEQLAIDALDAEYVTIWCDLKLTNWVEIAGHLADSIIKLDRMLLEYLDAARRDPLASPPGL